MQDRLTKGQIDWAARRGLAVKRGCREMEIDENERITDQDDICWIGLFIFCKAHKEWAIVPQARTYVGMTVKEIVDAYQAANVYQPSGWAMCGLD